MAAKTTELGQKTWGIMRGVMAMASQQVEAYTKEGGQSSSSNQFGSQYGSIESQNVGYQELNGNKSFETPKNGSHDSWSEWDTKKGSETKSTSTNGGGDSWAGWDDNKDDDDHFAGSHTKKSAGDGWGDNSWDAGFK